MNKIDTYQYELVKKLSFSRYGGTEGELEAAKIIADEIEGSGGQAEFMEFEIPAYECTRCSAAVNGRELDVKPYGNSGCLPEGGVDLRIVYICGSSEADFLNHKNLEGCLVLLNHLDMDTYKKLVEYKASAFAVISGLYYDSKDNTDLVERMLRRAYRSVGVIPGFVLRASEVLELLRNEEAFIHLELQQKDVTHISRNVLAVIEGTEMPEESIVICGHYDSVLVGTGSWDNATGAAMLNRLFRHFRKNPPKRTLRFVWCGSEEQGLLGSIAYIEQHLNLLDSVKFVFNFDMNGTVFGSNMTFITGTDDLKTYYEQTAKEYGYPSKVMVKVHSSDSAPFALKGIPSIGLSRGGMQFMDIHTRHDLMPTISPKELYNNFLFASYLIDKFSNAAILPVERKLPEDMEKQVKEYFLLDKLPDYKVFREE